MTSWVHSLTSKGSISLITVLSTYKYVMIASMDAAINIGSQSCITASMFDGHGCNTDQQWNRDCQTRSRLHGSNCSWEDNFSLPAAAIQLLAERWWVSHWWSEGFSWTWSLSKFTLYPLTWLQSDSLKINQMFTQVLNADCFIKQQARKCFGTKASCRFWIQLIRFNISTISGALFVISPLPNRIRALTGWS